MTHRLLQPWSSPRCGSLNALSWNDPRRAATDTWAGGFFFEVFIENWEWRKTVTIEWGPQQHNGDHILGVREGCQNARLTRGYGLSGDMGTETLFELEHDQPWACCSSFACAVRGQRPPLEQIHISCTNFRSLPPSRSPSPSPPPPPPAPSVNVPPGSTPSSAFTPPGTFQGQTHDCRYTSSTETSTISYDWGALRLLRDLTVTTRSGARYRFQLCGPAHSRCPVRGPEDLNAPAATAIRSGPSGPYECSRIGASVPFDRRFDPHDPSAGLNVTYMGVDAERCVRRDAYGPQPVARSIKFVLRCDPWSLALDNRLYSDSAYDAGAAMESSLRLREVDECAVEVVVPTQYACPHIVDRGQQQRPQEQSPQQPLSETALTIRGDGYSEYLASMHPDIVRNVLRNASLLDGALEVVVGIESAAPGVVAAIALSATFVACVSLICCALLWRRLTRLTRLYRTLQANQEIAALSGTVEKTDGDTFLDDDL